MGQTKGKYTAEFDEGTLVQIADRPTLTKFMSEWRFHNKLSSQQLEYAGKIAEVESVGFYHGGDELYKLKGIPGIWHEANLRASSQSL